MNHTFSLFIVKFLGTNRNSNPNSIMTTTMTWIFVKVQQDDSKPPHGQKKTLSEMMTGFLHMQTEWKTGQCIHA